MRAADSAPATSPGTASPAGRLSFHKVLSLVSRGRSQSGASGPSAGRSSYLPGLDGLRALAVIAVLIYHARPGWLPGGFLGVEVFFVISGFIITRALVSEWQESGRIALTSFWLRRARRLLPAVGLLLAAVLAYVAAFEPDEVARLRGDTLAALAYVTNWHLILGDQSYFDSFQRPSMLRHLWSLAIEEQFYILWPLVLAFGLPILRQRGLLVLTIAGIAASALGMALFYDPAGDNSRAYFGTDTRAAGLLVGAALAFVMAGSRAPMSAGGRYGLLVLGVPALFLLAGATLWLHEGKPFLYQGGFLAVGLTTAVLIWAVTQPNALSRVLGIAPLRWVGVRSYGIYLWHWPVYMLAWPREASAGQLVLQIFAIVIIAAASYALLERPVREGALGRVWQGLRAWPVQPLRYRGAAFFSGAGATAVVISLLAVAITAKPPEVPSSFETGSIRIQNVVLAQDAGSVARGPTLMGRVQTAISALTADERNCPSDSLLPDGTVVGVVSTPFGSTCPQPLALFEKPPAAENADAELIVISPEPSPEEVAALLAELEIVVPEPEVDEAAAPPAAEPAGVAESPPATEPSPAANAAPPATEQSEPAPPSAGPPAPNAAPPSQTVPSVTAIGDSVMMGAAYTLAGSIPGIDLDASIGRQASSAVALLQERAAAGRLGQVVVVHVGNNGTLTADHFDQLMAAIGADRTAVFLNLKVPRAWEDSNNAVIVNGVSRYGNAVLVDWAAAGAAYPELFNKDGIHLTSSGASYYTQLVADAVSGG